MYAADQFRSVAMATSSIGDTVGGKTFVDKKSVGCSRQRE